MQTLGLFLIILGAGTTLHALAFAVGVMTAGLPVWSPEVGAALLVGIVTLAVGSLAYRHD